MRIVPIMCDFGRLIGSLNSPCQRSVLYINILYVPTISNPDNITRENATTWKRSTTIKIPKIIIIFKLLL